MTMVIINLAAVVSMIAGSADSQTTFLGSPTNPRSDYNDTSRIPFTDSVYFSSAPSSYRCLRLIDFEDYFPIGVKKYSEMIRIIEEEDSRPICFEIGVFDSMFDLVTKYPDEPLGVNQCDKQNCRLIVTEMRNQPISRDSELKAILKIVRNYKTVQARKLSTATIDIEYTILRDSYTFRQRVSAYDYPALYDKAMAFIGRHFQRPWNRDQIMKNSAP
jgi:hypothetical protein